MDNKENFTGKASAYEDARPNYNKHLFHYLLEKEGITKDTVFADIGSGTGIFSENLLKMGNTVFAVEPNDDMRNISEKNLSKYPNFVSIKGNDANFNLPSSTIDYITVAQAFHWFDSTLFKKECTKVLTKKGKVILIWNSYDKENATIKELSQICKKFCPKFQGFSAGISEDSDRIKNFFDNNYKFIHFENNLEFNKDKFIKRMISSSYSLTVNDIQYTEFIATLESYFDKHTTVNNTIIMPNETIAYLNK